MLPILVGLGIAVLQVLLPQHYTVFNKILLFQGCKVIAASLAWRLVGRIQDDSNRPAAIGDVTFTMDFVLYPKDPTLTYHEQRSIDEHIRILTNQ
jgi:hypothetical protein